MSGVWRPFGFRSDFRDFYIDIVSLSVSKLIPNLGRKLPIWRGRLDMAYQTLQTGKSKQPFSLSNWKSRISQSISSIVTWVRRCALEAHWCNEGWIPPPRFRPCESRLRIYHLKRWWITAKQDKARTEAKVDSPKFRPTTMVWFAKVSRLLEASLWRNRWIHKR